MSREHEPSRLVEGDEPLEDALRQALRRAGEDGPSAAQLDAIVQGTLSSLGTAAGATGVADAVGGGAKSALLKAGWVKVVAAVVVLGSGGAWLAVELTGEPTDAPSSRDTGATEEPASRGAARSPAQPGGRGTDASTHLQPGPSPTLQPVVESLVREGSKTRPAPSPERGRPERPSGARGRGGVAPGPQTDLGRVGASRSPSIPGAAPSSQFPSGSSKRSVLEGDADRRPAVQATGSAAEIAAPAAEGDTPDEVALLSRAQTALTAQPGMALALLARHRRAHPESSLAQERDAMELEALLRLHRHEALRERGRAFLRRYPGSPHRERIRELLHEAGAR